MTIISKTSKPDEISLILKQKANTQSSKGNLSTHFGKLKRNIDGLAYQKKIREDEN